MHRRGRPQRRNPHHQAEMEFFSLAELGDPKIFQAKQTKYVVVTVDQSGDIVAPVDDDDFICAGDGRQPVISGGSHDDVIMVGDDASDTIDCGLCSSEPGLYETNKELFYSLGNIVNLDQLSSEGVKAPAPFWVGEVYSLENPLLNSGKVEVII